MGIIESILKGLVTENGKALLKNVATGAISIMIAKALIDTNKVNKKINQMDRDIEYVEDYIDDILGRREERRRAREEYYYEREDKDDRRRESRRERYDREDDRDYGRDDRKSGRKEYRDYRNDRRYYKDRDYYERSSVR